jgi:hypothetical protein
MNKVISLSSKKIKFIRDMRALIFALVRIIQRYKSNSPFRKIIKEKYPLMDRLNSNSLLVKESRSILASLLREKLEFIMIMENCSWRMGKRLIFMQGYRVIDTFLTMFTKLESPSSEIIGNTPQGYALEHTKTVCYCIQKAAIVESSRVKMRK